MIAVPGERIVAGWTYNAFGMPAFRVHAIDYPEVEAEGRTPDEARDRLVLLLSQAIDYTGEAWKYQPLSIALADARAFAVDARRPGPDHRPRT